MKITQHSSENSSGNSPTCLLTDRTALRTKQAKKKARFTESTSWPCVGNEKAIAKNEASQTHLAAVMGAHRQELESYYSGEKILRAEQNQRSTDFEEVKTPLHVYCIILSH